MPRGGTGGAAVGTARFRLQAQRSPSPLQLEVSVANPSEETCSDLTSPTSSRSPMSPKRPSICSNTSGGVLAASRQAQKFHKARWETTTDFEDSVPPPAGTTPIGICKAGLASFLKSPLFDVIIGAVIIANAISIGLEQAYRGDSEVTRLTTICDNIFLSVYMVELALRFFAFGWACLSDSWVVFDAFLVVMGILTQWILTPLLGSVDEVGPLMVLRTARLMRLAKTVRLLIKFKELWMLVQGLLSSANTMLYTLLLLFVIIYIFACLGLELLFEHPKSVGPDADPEFTAAASQHFGSLMTAMLTLMQFVTFDNVVTVYHPLARNDPVLCVYFIAVLLIVGIVVMNLVTAVVVNSALEQTAQDKNLMKAMEDEKHKKFLKDLRKVFIRLDGDRSGEISKKEIKSMSQQDLQNLQQLTGLDSAMDIFDALDVDRSGQISIDEFCDGLWEVAISQTPIEIKRMERQVETIRFEIGKQRVEQQRMRVLLTEIHRAVALPEQETAGSSNLSEMRRFGTSPDKLCSAPETSAAGMGAVSTVQTRCEMATAAAQIAKEAAELYESQLVAVKLMSSAAAASHESLKTTLDELSQAIAGPWTLPSGPAVESNRIEEQGSSARKDCPSGHAGTSRIDRSPQVRPHLDFESNGTEEPSAKSRGGHDTAEADEELSLIV